MKSIRASITGAAAFMTAMAPAVALAADGSGRYSSVDTLWVIFGACLVFFMQHFHLLCQGLLLSCSFPSASTG